MHFSLRDHSLKKILCWYKERKKVKLLSHVRLFAVPWSTRFFRQWDFLDKNTGVGCHFLLQEIFLTQGLNPGLLHCRQMFYHLSHQGSPIGIEKSIGIEKAFFLVERYKIDTINLFTWYIYTLPCFRENLRQLTKMLKNKLAS